jgi:hypothetical protein
MPVLFATAAVAWLIVGALGYYRAARVATGLPDVRPLVVVQVALTLATAMPMAFLAFGLFLTGRPLEGVGVFVASVIGGPALMGLGTEVAWWRHGRPDASRQSAAASRLREQMVTQSPTLPWFLLGLMSIAAIAATSSTWLFYASPITRDVAPLLAMVPPATAMALSAAMVLAARVRASQPFVASAAASAVLGAPGLATGFYFASHASSEPFLFGWTVYCVFMACVSLALTIYFRAVVRAVNTQSHAAPDGDAS